VIILKLKYVGTSIKNILTVIVFGVAVPVIIVYLTFYSFCSEVYDEIKSCIGERE
jgi:hypothetical protein